MRKPWVTKPKGSKTFVIRWKTPNNETKQRATTHTRRRDAERDADALAAELDAGATAGDMRWVKFKQRYEAEGLSHCRPSTKKKWKVAATLVTSRLHPRSVKSLNQNKLSKLRGELLEEGMTAATADSYFRHIIAALSWAKTMGMIANVPSMPRKRGKKQRHMKGRPISLEEFERLLQKTGEVVKDKNAEGWKLLLWGLWEGGFRLNEAIELSWDDPTKILVVDIDDARPKINIPADLDKGDEDRLYPLAPPLVKRLRNIPQHQRTGFVFNHTLSRGRCKSLQHTSKIISDIGKAALVKVTGDKFASAHDLRRSFGTRWSRKVMPVTLQRLMRHADISTTMRYYVGHEADQFADVLWDAVANEGDKKSDTAPAHETTKSKKGRVFKEQT